MKRKKILLVVTTYKNYFTYHYIALTTLWWRGRSDHMWRAPFQNLFLASFRTFKFGWQTVQVFCSKMNHSSKSVIDSSQVKTGAIFFPKYLKIFFAPFLNHSGCVRDCFILLKSNSLISNGFSHPRNNFVL